MLKKMPSCYDFKYVREVTNTNNTVFVSRQVSQKVFCPLMKPFQRVTKGN
jgi:hypothetical protein